MRPSTIYRGSFVNTETDRPANANIQKVIFVDIGDQDNLVGDTDPQTIIDIELAEQPALLSVIDNSEEPFTPIRALQATITCYTRSGFDISIFADGSDQRFSVLIYNEDGFIYLQGFLSTADLQQEFLPDPNVLTLTATDGLGLLNDIDLTDFDGDVPQNEQQIIDFIAWCLAKTGNTNMNISCVMNIRHKLAPTIDTDIDGSGHFYKYCWLHSLTFEDGIGKRINCYDVLVRILGDNSTLFQYNGEWWVRRLDEVEYGHDYYVTRFDSTGAWISNTVEVYERSVGVDLPLSWMNDDANEMLERLFKKITETYKYELPEERPCNVDFSRGAVIDDSNPLSKTYEIECWQSARANYPTSDLIPATTDIYIKRIFILPGVETERYVVIEAVTPPNSNLIMSSRIYMAQKDRVDFSFARSLSADITGSGAYTDTLAQVRLYGDDGTFWTLHGGTNTDPTPRWTTNNSTFTGVNELIQYQGDASEDLTEVVTKFVEAPPLPVAGFIRVLLYQSALWGNIRDTYIRPVEVNIRAYINGTYELFTGQEHSVTQTARTINVRAKQVYVSDSPSQAFKGAILVANTGTLIYTDNTDFVAPDTFIVPGDKTNTFTPGRRIRIDFTASNNRTVTIVSSTYHVIPNNTEVVVLESVVTEDDQPATFYDASFSLANEFYSGHVFPSGPPDDTYIHPFGHLQAFDIWNQFNRVMRRFEGTVDGTADIPSLLHKYFLTDTNPNTDDRIFQLLHTEIELHLCQWSAYFAEVVKSDVPKLYDGHEFKYLTN